MVLGSNFTAIANQIFNWVIQTPVAMVHFISGDTIGKSQKLMSQADAKKRFFRAQNLLNQLHCMWHGCRITRTVGNKIAIRLKVFTFLQGNARREDFQICAPIDQALQNYGV